MANPSEGVLESLVKELKEKIDLGKVDEAKELLPEIQRRVHDYESEANVAHVRYLVSKTPTNKKRVGKTEIDFSDWQRILEDSYRKRLRITGHEAEELRKVLFRTKMDLFLRSNAEFSDIPMAYCDVNRQLLCTPVVYDLFGIEPEKQLGLKDLLEHVDREDSRHILDSLKNGVRLKDYQLRDVRNLKLNSYPLYFSEMPVGVALILQSPDIAIEDGRLFRFVRGILRSVHEMSTEYNFIKSKVEEKSYD
jgi:hypothetical protein